MSEFLLKPEMYFFSFGNDTGNFIQCFFFSFSSFIVKAFNCCRRLKTTSVTYRRMLQWNAADSHIVMSMSKECSLNRANSEQRPS